MSWLLNHIGKGFGYLIHGKRVGKWAAMLMLSAPAWSAQVPFFPYLTGTFTATGMATASISVSVYADKHPEITISATQFLSHGPLTEWALSVVGTGGTSTPGWTVDIEVSNDDLTWTPIVTHDRTASASGRIVWGAHKRARRARMTARRINVGTTVTATAYGEP